MEVRGLRVGGLVRAGRPTGFLSVGRSLAVVLVVALGALVAPFLVALVAGVFFLRVAAFVLLSVVPEARAGGLAEAILFLSLAFVVSFVEFVLLADCLRRLDVP